MKEEPDLMSLLRLVPLGALLLVMGCSQRITVCPVPAILADTQTVTVFRPGTTPDPANELFTVSLVNSEGDCTLNTRDATVDASMELTFRATRTPTGLAPTMMAGRRDSGLAAWRRSSREPMKVAAHCTSGVATAQIGRAHV